MKKFLFGILTFLGIGLSFCSAFDITEPGQIYVGSFGRQGDLITDCFSPITITYAGDMTDMYFFGYMFNANGNSITASTNQISPRTNYSFSPWCSDSEGYFVFGLVDLKEVGELFTLGVGGGCTPEDITIFYNNGNSSTDITCDGTQAIEIQGLSTITSTNTFTPFFNISYKDEDNQSLIESYSKDILYLNGLFKKTYTGDNERILTSQLDSESIFTGYLPTFEITGGINDVTESGNIFNNFAENSVKFTLANIPSYIQYFIILLLLFLILGFVKKFKRK